MKQSHCQSKQSHCRLIENHYKAVSGVWHCSLTVICLVISTKRRYPVAGNSSHLQFARRTGLFPTKRRYPVAGNVNIAIYYWEYFLRFQQSDVTLSRGISTEYTKRIQYHKFPTKRRYPVAGNGIPRAIAILCSVSNKATLPCRGEFPPVSSAKAESTTFPTKRRYPVAGNGRVLKPIHTIASRDDLRELQIMLPQLDDNIQTKSLKP